MSELHWRTASPEDNNNSLKHDLLKGNNNSARDAAVHMMQNRCKFQIKTITQIENIFGKLNDKSFAFVEQYFIGLLMSFQESIEFL